MKSVNVSKKERQKRWRIEIHRQRWNPLRFITPKSLHIFRILTIFLSPLKPFHSRLLFLPLFLSLAFCQAECFFYWKKNIWVIKFALQSGKMRYTVSLPLSFSFPHLLGTFTILMQISNSKWQYPHLTAQSYDKKRWNLMTIIARGALCE